MIEKLAETMLRFKENTAYICKNEKLSFGELYNRARDFAKKLKNDDFSPVAVIGGRNADTMAAILGCVFAKRAYVPIDISLPEERKNRIISLSKAGTVIDCSKEKPDFEKTENRAQTREENKTAYIIFTSGSTGEPKGVPISYKNLDNFIEWITLLEPLDKFEHANVLNQAAFSFDLSTAAIYYALFCGHAIVQIENKNDFSGIIDTIKQNKPEVLVATPTFIKLCLLDKCFCQKDFSFIKCIYFCGETLQKSLCKAIFERFSDIRVINAYGPTEATSAVCAIEITKEMCEQEEILPVGKISSAAAEIFIENKEIVLKGKSVFAGYLGKDDDFSKGYPTGDLGCIENGRLYCFGRLDSQIKYKGYRIELLEIENNICAVKGVENCAVIAKRNEHGEVRMIKAFYSGKAAEEEIRAALLQKLPEYMIPKTIKKLENLPVSTNGKTDRKELEKL